MPRKEGNEPKHVRGLAEVIGIALLAMALLLLAAQWSFERGDLPFVQHPPHDPAHNWIGPFGAHLAYGGFYLIGLAAYLVPPLLGLFGVALLLGWPAHFRARPWRHAGLTLLLVLCVAGLLHLANQTEALALIRTELNAPSAGGKVGWLLYKCRFGNYATGCFVLGEAGAAIVYGTLFLVSLMFLTDFHLATWIARWRAEKDEELEKLPPAERDLKIRARELEKKKRELEEEVAKASGQPNLGIDGQPVPPPQVRDLSGSQLKPAPAKAKKPEEDVPVAPPFKEPEPADEEVVVVTGREVGKATAADILGKPAAPPAEPARTESPSPATVAAKASPPGPQYPAPKILDQSGAAKRKKPKPMSVAQPTIIGNYQLPPMDLLQLPDTTVKPTESKEELMANARLMQQTLAQFDITITPGDITKGPTFTRYELHPAPGVKLERIVALTNNLAAALKAERIHILAPVPGKGSVGIEVPNPIKTKVIMRDLLESDEWRNTKCRIPIALGKDVYGHPIIQDLAEMPHLLIAGSTGSGKSVCINSVIASLLYRFGPDQLRFVMIDPKVVELQHYNVLPHLVVPVVTDPKKVVLALRWVVNEMEKRYQIFARVGVRNIKSFNDRPKGKPLPPVEPELPLMAKKEKVEAGADGFAVEVDEQIVVPRDEDIVIPEKLSYIVVVVDELADLMLVAPADVEMSIARITQMARAAGIHVIVATQRPSVDVITGVIKANIPARIAFQVASRVDSRTILDAMGADKLLGKGDLLFLPPGSAKLLRCQGALITDQEIQGIVDFIAKQGKPNYELEITQQLAKREDESAGEEGSGEDEEVIQDCIAVIRSEQKASVSLLQRRLRLGYGRAARIMDELEQRGIVGPSKGAEPRDILIDLDGGGADGSASAGDEDLAQK
jgi:S-DNA-T family DNA segregation ATPase FtsK/SpoIIIE